MRFTRERLFKKGEVVDGVFYPKNLVLEAVQDYQVTYLMSWEAPLTTGGTDVLPAKTKIKVKLCGLKASAAHCLPIEYEEIHALFLTESFRNQPKYAGYYLVIDLSDLEKFFRVCDEKEEDVRIWTNDGKS